MNYLGYLKTYLKAAYGLSKSYISNKVIFKGYLGYLGAT
jgi:hypothetical protein